MSEDLRNRIADDVRAVIDAEVVSRLAATGQVASPGGPAEFAAEIAQQAGKVAEFAKTLGIEHKSP
jgi:tripartite-type tricarboxylate transporter receptor subunit TctC